jgi:hypothetical protein
MTHNQPQETITGAVVIPLLQAVTTGALIGTTAGAAGWALRWENPGAVGLATGAAVASLAWVSYRADWSDRIRAVLGIEPPTQTTTTAAAFNQTVRLEILSDGGRSGDYLSLPGGRERLIILAKGLTSGKPLTIRTWTGNNGVYSGSEFEQLRAELISRGFARWQSEHDHRAGATLTGKGAAVMRGLSLTSSPPPPSLGFHLEGLNTSRNSTETLRHTAGE